MTVMIMFGLSWFVWLIGWFCLFDCFVVVCLGGFGLWWWWWICRFVLFVCSFCGRLGAYKTCDLNLFLS